LNFLEQIDRSQWHLTIFIKSKKPFLFEKTFLFFYGIVIVLVLYSER